MLAHTPDSADQVCALAKRTQGAAHPSVSRAELHLHNGSAQRPECAAANLGQGQGQGEPSGSLSSADMCGKRNERRGVCREER